MSQEPALRRWVSYALIGALLLALLPTVTWFDFDESMEGVVAATALESTREHQYLVPILNGKPRVRKPPLATWVAMIGIRPRTVARLDDTSPEARQRAYRELAWQIRWTGVIVSCLLALGAAELGRLVGGNALGVMTFLVVASCGLFTRHSRIASFDTQLALWVTWTNVLILRGMLTRKYWSSFTLAGVALGLAFLSKGPIALIQSILPMAVAAWWMTWEKTDRAAIQRVARPDELSERKDSQLVELRLVGPVLVGLLISVCLALPWTIWILKTVPNAYGTWKAEALREHGAAQGFDTFWEYIKLLRLMLPWSILFGLGIVMATFSVRKRPLVCVPLLLLFVPVLIMSFFPDKQDRYLLPMVAPACILTAWAVLGTSQLIRERRANRFVLLLIVIHIGLIGFYALRWPLIGGWARVLGDQLQFFGRTIPMTPKDVHDLTESWPVFSPILGAITLGVMLIVWIAGIVLQWRWVWALGAMTAIAGLGGDTLKLYGKPHERNSIPDLSAMLANDYPKLPIYTINTSPPSDFLIYTNRASTRVSSWDEIPHDGPKIVLTQRKGRHPQQAVPPRADARHLMDRRRVEQWLDAWYLPE
jgi:4-amino-4-deoxy-L-arabinose transferase-like glycosyltransferase